MQEPDFTDDIDTIERYGYFGQSPAQIESRVLETLDELIAAPGVDMGVIESSARLLRGVEAAVHETICDSEQGMLRPGYQNLLESGVAKAAVGNLASTVFQAVVSIEPVLGTSALISRAVSLIALKLVNLGLNRFCSRPV